MSSTKRQKIKFKVYDAHKKKTIDVIGGIGLEEATGEPMIVDLDFSDSIGEWEELGDRYLLRIYLGGKLVYESPKENRGCPICTKSPLKK